jgi:hypothetical protein
MLLSRAFGLALATLTLATAAQQNPPRVYYFIDDQGVPHFSNVPADSRYKLFSGTEDLTARPAPAMSAAPAPAIPPPQTMDEVPMPPEEEDDQNDQR